MASPSSFTSARTLPTRDPYLDAHIKDPGIVDLAGKVFPGSIRDQILRAILVTEALWRQQLIRRNQRSLVIGAGAAGVAAALVLSKNGIEVWLVDQEPEVLSTFRENTARVVSPAIYDWPSSHAQSEFYGTGAPFNRSKRIVFAFPILDSDDEVIALGSVGFRQDKLARSAGLPPSREYLIEELEPNK